MSLTADQLSWLRSELGDKPDSGDLETRYDRLDSVRDVAIEVLRERRNAMLEKPLTSTLAGVGSASFADNAKLLAARIKELTGLDDDPSQPGDDTVDGSSRFEEITLTRARRR